MDISNFAAGYTVKLDVRTKSAKGSFDAKIVYIYKNILILEPILIKGKIVGFPPNCTIDLTFIENDVLYIWSNVRVRAVSFKGRKFHAVPVIGEGVASNRRSNYRVYIGTQMTINYFTDSGIKTHNAFIKDISETGFAFISKDEFDVGRTVRLNIPMPAKMYISITAKIVRAVPSERPMEFLYGCHFSENNPKLATFLMSFQRDKQKKKMGKPNQVRRIQRR